MIFAIAAIAIIILASLAYGYSLPDPSSWVMPSDAEAEYDRQVQEFKTLTTKDDVTNKVER